MDAAPTVSDTAHVPASLANPLTVARVQSAYRAADAVSGTLVVTFTVFNNLSPATTSSLPVSTTGTSALSSTLDLAHDPHTIHNVLLTDGLVGLATYVDAAPEPDRRDTQSAWNLGDIQPLQSATVVLTLTVPATGTDFSTLDTGASVWGTLEGRAVTALARPAGFAPDNVSDGPTGDWLRSTVDANITDQYMLNQAGIFTQDPLREFSYVQGLGYESYKGSLRGTRGTLWSQAGNSLDKASLLIAMLRASGIPSRYRHGTLSTPLAQQLILSMFPAPTQLVGRISPGTALADPAHDSKLLTETQDHWWVEANLPGSGWQDLDPSFMSATVGQDFVDSGSFATDGTDRSAEVPDTLRHKVTLTVKVESYSATNWTSNPLNDSYPLQHTFNSVELVGIPVTLAHLVSTSAPPGLIFSVMQDTYTPYFQVGGQIIQGQPFSDFISNFPFAQQLVTGEWLEFDTRDANGATQHYERTVKDMIGFAARAQGGNVSLPAGTGTGPFITTQDRLTTLFAPGTVSETALSQQLLATAAQGQLLVAANSSLQSQDPATPAGTVATQVAQTAVTTYLNDQLLVDCLEYYDGYDAGAVTLGASMLAHVYANNLRIVTAASVVSGTTGISPTIDFSMDVQNNSVVPVPSPLQAITATTALNTLIGMFSATVEDRVMSAQNPDGISRSVSEVFQVAKQNGISIIQLDQAHLSSLASTSLSAEAQARIVQDLQRGQVVIVPAAMVPLGPTTTVGWYAIDPHTGVVTDTMENGQHQDEVEYSLLLSTYRGFLVSEAEALVVHLIVAWLNTLCQSEKSLKDNVTEELAKQFSLSSLVQTAASSLVDALGEEGYLAAEAFGLDLKFFDRIQSGYELGKAGLDAWLRCSATSPVGSPPGSPPGSLPGPSPLPSAFLANPLTNLNGHSGNGALGSGTLPANVISRTVPGTDTPLPTGTILTAPSVTFDGAIGSTWESTAQQGILFTHLSAGHARLLDQSGSRIDTGATVSSAAPASALVEGSVTTAASGQGSLSLYPGAENTVLTSAAWDGYAARLTASTNPFSISLSTVPVTSTNGVYTGPLTLSIPDVADLNGAGPTLAPTFSGRAVVTGTQAGLMFGPAMVTSGSLPFDASNGFALVNFSGSLTIAPMTSITDQVQLASSADYFAVHTSPTATTTHSTGPVTFHTAIDSSARDTYTTTVEAPDGWNVALDATGLVTATPPLSAAPGDYTLLVTIRSGSHPDLFASAIHTVTVTPHQGMVLQVNPDPQTTVPFGPANPNAVPGDTNNGQLQLTGAAYTVDITNTSTTSHTFNINVSGLPAGWTILSASQDPTSTAVTLPPGGFGQVGLYISPTVASLPPAGTQYPFSVHVTSSDAPPLDQSATQTFTVPAIAFSHLTTDQATVYSSPGLTTTIDLGIQNVGNLAGTFPLSITQPISTWTASVVSPVSLDPGQIITQNITLLTPDGTIGQTYPVQVSAPAGGYTQTTTINVQLVGQNALLIDRAAQVAAQLYPGDTALSSDLLALAQRIDQLRTACATATTLGAPGQTACSTDLRDAVVSTANQVAYAADTISPMITVDSAIRQTAQALGQDTTVQLARLTAHLKHGRHEHLAAVRSAGAVGTALFSDLDTLTSEITVLQIQLGEVAAHGARLIFAPGRRVVLGASPATFNLSLTNQGSVTTTYTITLTPSSPTVAVSPTVQDLSIAPGAVITIPVTASASTLGSAAISATVAVGGAPDLAPLTGNVSVTSVDALLRVTSLTITPPFIESGSGGTASVAALIANVANEAISGAARLRLLDTTGTEVYSTTQPVQIASALTPMVYSLGTISTTGLLTGTYTVMVDVLDSSGQIIPQATAQTTFGIGQAIHTISAVSPAVVAPGDVTVTTSITTELDLNASGCITSTTPGGIFITGHDPDFHAAYSASENELGARHIIQRAIAFVTAGKLSPRILLITDLQNPGGIQEDPRLGLQAAGFTGFDVADYGSGTSGILDLHTVDLNKYDVVMVASDFGGWLRQEELDILNARSADLLKYVDSGGGIVALAESGGRPDGSYAGTSHDRFAFLPFVVSSMPFAQYETGNTITPAGAALGLTNNDVNGNYSHNVFTVSGGLDTIDIDASGEMLSLAEYGRAVTSSGVCSSSKATALARLARVARRSVALRKARNADRSTIAHSTQTTKRITTPREQTPTPLLPHATGGRHVGDASPLARIFASSDTLTATPMSMVTPDPISTTMDTATPSSPPTDVPTGSLTTTATTIIFVSTVTPDPTSADAINTPLSNSPTATPTSILTTAATVRPTPQATSIPPATPPAPQKDQSSPIPTLVPGNPTTVTSPQLGASSTNTPVTPTGSSLTTPTGVSTATGTLTSTYLVTATRTLTHGQRPHGIRSSDVGGGSYLATDFVTNLANNRVYGPIGLAFDASRMLYVMDQVDGLLYKFGPEGGVASPATQVSAGPIPAGPTGLAFSKDGSHLYLARNSPGDVVELDPSTGAIVRQVATNICGAEGLVTDPVTGDLFVTRLGCSGGVARIQSPDSGSPTWSVYTSDPRLDSPDGITAAGDGTLYVATQSGHVLAIAGTGATAPGAVTSVIDLPGSDGIAVAASGTFLLDNRTNGTITKIDLTTAPATPADIVIGGSRGDFVTVGPDGCLYADQTSTIEKVTNADGTCSLRPTNNLSYIATIEHDVPVTGVAILTGTLAPPPLATINGLNRTDLLWQQTLNSTVPMTVETFQSVLPAMQPGEVRQVAAGTVVTYTGGNVPGVLHLGPLYAAAAHLVALSPPQQAVGLGGQTIYTVTLSNPTQASLTLTPTVAGLPNGWVPSIGSRTLSAGEQISVPLTVSVPSSKSDMGAPSLLGDHPFTVLVRTDSSGQDQAGASLTVVDPLDLAVSPPLVSGSDGDVVSYTVTITNRDAVDHIYALTTTNLAPNTVALPSTVSVPAGQATSVPMTVGVHALIGLYPFTVGASAGTMAAHTANAELDVLGDRRVTATLTPTTAIGGPGVPVLYNLTVTNTASLSDTYGLTVQTPPGWAARVEANGIPRNTLSLAPYVLNAATLSLIITPTTDTAPGDYPVTVTVGSRSDPVIQAVTSATLTVSPYGVQVSLSPRHTTLDPTGTGAWQVTVTNTGIRPDTYDLAPTGIISSSARVTPATVSLNPGQSQVVQMTAGPLLFALAQTFGFGVTAQSQAEPAVHNADTGDITFTGYHAVEAALQPSAQTLTDTLQTSYTLLITNTGNLDSFYTFAPHSTPAGPVLTTELPMLEVPAHATSALLLTALGKAAGAYALTVQVASTEGAASGTASGSLVIDAGAVPSPTTTSIAPATPTVTSSPTITPTAMATPTPTLSPQPALTPTQTPIASVTVSPSPRPSSTATLTAQSTAITPPSPTPSFPTPTLPAATPMASPSATTIVVAQATATSNPVPPALPPAPTLTSTGAPSTSSVAPTTTPTALPTNTPLAQIRVGAMRSPTPVAPPTGEATATVGSPATATSLEAAPATVETSTPIARSTATAAAPRRPRVPTATVTALSPSASATASAPLPPSTTPVVATPTGAPHQEATTGSATPSSTGLPGTFKQHKTATAVALATSTTLALNAELSRAAAQATAAAVAAEHRRTAVHVTATPLPVPSTTATARSRPTSLPPGPRQGHHFVPSTATAVVPRLPNTGSSGSGHGNDNWLAKWLSLTFLLIGLLALIARRRKGTKTLPLS